MGYRGFRLSKGLQQVSNLVSFQIIPWAIYCRSPLDVYCVTVARISHLYLSIYEPHRGHQSAQESIQFNQQISDIFWCRLNLLSQCYLVCAGFCGDKRCTRINSKDPALRSPARVCFCLYFAPLVLPLLHLVWLHLANNRPGCHSSPSRGINQTWVQMLFEMLITLTLGSSLPGVQMDGVCSFGTILLLSQAN